MAVQEQTPQIEYVANGVTKSFPLTFDCEDQDHLIVTVNDVELSVGSWMLIDENVSFKVAPANGSNIVIQRNTPLERTTTYKTYNNSFRPEPVNKDLDRIWWKLQELGLADWLLSKRLDNETQDRILADLALKADYILRDSKLKIDYIDRDAQLKKYIDSMIALVTSDASFDGIDASMVIDSSRLSQQEINDISISVLNRGAKSNATPFDNFDSTAAFKDSLDFEWVTYPAAASLAYYPKSKNKRIRVPLGRYLITDTLPLTSYLHLDFDDGVVIDFKPTSKKSLFDLPTPKMKAAYAAGHKSWKDMTLYGLQITGAALFKGNMTATSDIHATYAVRASNSHRGNFSRFAIEGFEFGLSIDRLDTTSWTGSRIGNFYENVVDNVTIQDCKLPFYNSGNLTTMINCRIGHETLRTTDKNMGDYLIEQHGAGFTSLNLNIASMMRAVNPKKGHIFETCMGSTYHGLYSEYFDALFIVDPINRWGGLKIDAGHIVKYPTDMLIRFVDGYLPSYDPATGKRGGRNLKGASNWIELLGSGIQVFNSNAELLPDFFEFTPQYDFKYGMYGCYWYWTQNIAVDFKRWETASTGFLSSNGARFIATQKATLVFPIKQNQYDAYVCVLARVLTGAFITRDIKLNVYGTNEYITTAETVFDYGNGWVMYAVRNAQLDPKVKTNLQIDLPAGVQLEIEHIGAYKNGVPLYPNFQDRAPRVNADNFMFSGGNDIDRGAFINRVSGGQFGVGDVLAPFIPVINGVADTTRPIANQFVLEAGSNRATTMDGNHAAYWGDAIATFNNGVFDSDITATGNNRKFSESIGVGMYLSAKMSSITEKIKVIGREYDADLKAYTYKLSTSSALSGSVILNHRGVKPTFFNLTTIPAPPIPPAPSQV